jgi:hypothetical protein
LRGVDPLLTHPLFAFGCIWLPLIALLVVRRREQPITPALGGSLVLAVSSAALLAYVAIVVWYACQFTYFDRAEPTITAVASVFAAGKPLYPALDAPERYAHIYGPGLFIVHAAAMALLGQSILVSKAVGVSAILVSLIVGYWLFAARAGKVVAFAATAACALVYMGFSNATFWTRPDPILIACAVVGLYCAILPRSIVTLIVLGVVTGAALNLKVSGPLYLLPAFALAGGGSQDRWWHLAGSAGVAGVVGVAPFLLANVSLSHYLEYLELSARNGLVAAKLRQNLEWVLFFLLPLAGVSFRRRVIASEPRKLDLFVLSLGCSLLAVAVVAAKPGGGPYHLLPFLPALAYAVLRSPVQWDQPITSSMTAAFALTALAIAVPRQVTFVTTVMGRHLASQVGDLRRFADAHPSKRVAVGYAGTSSFSDARPEIVFRSREYLLDAPAIQEHRLAGLEVPASTIRALTDCDVEYWLIPRGAQAFDVPSAYWPDGPEKVFPESFRQAFFRSYQRTASTRYFDVWECRHVR